MTSKFLFFKRSSTSKPEPSDIWMSKSTIFGSCFWIARNPDSTPSASPTTSSGKSALLTIFLSNERVLVSSSIITTLYAIILLYIFLMYGVAMVTFVPVPFSVSNLLSLNILCFYTFHSITKFYFALVPQPYFDDFQRKVFSFSVQLVAFQFHYLQ